MNAVTEKRLKGKLEPTPNGSIYVKPAEMEWKDTKHKGIKIRTLYENVESGELTCLLKWEPGTTLPFHRHPELEQTFVLQGSFYDHDGIAREGEFTWRKPGSLHQTQSDEGCIILAIYKKPNVFFDHDAGF